MPRATGTQTRTFNYTTGTTVGTLLLSATNPENGTVTYTYNTDKTLATKTDALNQQFSYTYDSYKRITQINLGQTVIRQFYYDSNPVDSTFSQNIAGRLAAVQNAPTTNGDTFIEMYVSVRPTQGRLQSRVFAQRAGVKRATSDNFRRFMPGRTSSKYSFADTASRRHDSTTEIIAATFGPACALPTCSQFLRPNATGRIEFSARLLDNSTSA